MPTPDRYNLHQVDGNLDHMPPEATLMLSPFARKLCGYSQLSEAEVTLVEDETAPARMVQAYKDLIREGDKPGPVFLVLEGWACRYKVLPDGSRQIMAFLMPGDFCDIHAAVLDEMIIPSARSPPAGS